MITLKLECYILKTLLTRQVVLTITHHEAVPGHTCGINLTNVLENTQKESQEDETKNLKCKFSNASYETLNKLIELCHSEYKETNIVREYNLAQTTLSYLTDSAFQLFSSENIKTEARCEARQILGRRISMQIQKVGKKAKVTNQRLKKT